jgi:hypothetical protein
LRFGGVELALRAGFRVRASAPGRHVVMGKWGGQSWGGAASVRYPPWARSSGPACVHGRGHDVGARWGGGSAGAGLPSRAARHPAPQAGPVLWGNEGRSVGGDEAGVGSVRGAQPRSRHPHGAHTARFDFPFVESQGPPIAPSCVMLPSSHPVPCHQEAATSPWDTPPSLSLSLLQCFLHPRWRHAGRRRSPCGPPPRPRP